MPRSPLQQELRKRRPFDSAEVELFLNLQRTAAMLHNEVERLLKTRGLTSSTYNVLRILRGARAGGDSALPCQEIAERLVSPVPDVTRLIDRLERDGLVERQRASADRRVVRVSITRSGLQTLARLDQPILRLHRAQFSHLQRNEFTSLNELLVNVRRSRDKASL